MTPVEIGLFFAALSFCLGLLGKMLLDYFQSGRVRKKDAYMLTTDCEARREQCCLPAIKKEVATIDTRLKETEKKLDHGEAKFDMLMKETSSIRVVVERILVSIEYALEIKHKDNTNRRVNR